MGYDPRDRSSINSIYLVYLVIFFSIWGFAVLTLLADLGAEVLSLAGELPPDIAAIWTLAAVLLSVTCIRGYQSGVRSPFIFSDTDAEIICQTPLDRSQVALVWFLGDWFLSGLSFTTLAVVSCFASLQMAMQGGFDWAHLPAFLLAGIKAACIAFLLHMTFTSLAYALGALRLNRSRDIRWIRWLPFSAGVLLVTVLFRNTTIAQFALWPLVFPLQASFGITNWYLGLIVALFLVTLSLFTLYWSSRSLNLSRAAQESRSQWSSQQAALLGDTRLIQVMKFRQKLGIEHKMSRIPSKEGILSLLWKESVVATRSLQFSTVLTWLGVSTACLAMLVTSDWGTRAWAFVIWGLLVAGRCTTGLRSDLGVWTLTRQLPFSVWGLVFADCIAPTSAAILIAWLSLVISYFLGSQPPVYLVVLLPLGCLCIVTSAIFDLIRHSHTSELLAGQVAEPGAGGLVIGLVLAVIPILLVSWLLSLFPEPALLIPISLLGMGLAIAGTYGIWSLVAYTYRNIS